MRPAIIFVIVYILACAVNLIIDRLFHPAPLANILGFLALLCYLATLLPSIVRAIFSDLKKHPVIIWLLKYRRYVGVASFGFAANHGALLMIERNLNFLDWHTCIHYFQGLFSFAILIILTVTSNDSSLKAMKQNWKKLHQLSYLLIVILPWHIGDKMSDHWTVLTPVGLSLTIGMGLLLAWRKWRERSRLGMPTRVQKPEPQIFQTSSEKP